MSKNGQVYKKHRPLKVVLTVIAIILAAVLLLGVFLYFWFQRYIVYTSDGLYLDIPWLEDVRGTRGGAVSGSQGAGNPDDTLSPDSIGSSDGTSSSDGAGSSGDAGASNN